MKLWTGNEDRVQVMSLLFVVFSFSSVQYLILLFPLALIHPRPMPSPPSPLNPNYNPHKPHTSHPKRQTKCQMQTKSKKDKTHLPQTSPFPHSQVSCKSLINLSSLTFSPATSFSDIVFKFLVLGGEVEKCF
jgi:hypothetical protein